MIAAIPTRFVIIGPFHPYSRDPAAARCHLTMRVTELRTVRLPEVAWMPTW